MKTVGTLEISDVTEHEDGSATFEFTMDDKTKTLLAEVGLEVTIRCAAFGVDLQYLYDWIESHGVIE